MDVPKLPEAWVYWNRAIDKAGRLSWIPVVVSVRPKLQPGDPNTLGPVSITSAAAAEAVREFVRENTATLKEQVGVEAIANCWLASKGIKDLGEQLEWG